MQLNTKRQEVGLIKDRVKKECLVCGVVKAHLQKQGINWKEHIFEEHNFRKMVLFMIYLLDKPDAQCTSLEVNLKDKIVSCNAEFFDDLKVDRKPNRLAQGFSPADSSAAPPD